MLWIHVVVVFAAIMTASATAHAVDYKMFVLIDASGSMVAPAEGGTRFDAAKNAALNDIASVVDVLLPSDTFQVAVYTFTCNGFPCATSEPMLIRHTGAEDGAGAFVSRNAAVLAINGLDVATHVGGNTPLAGAMCIAVDTIANAFPAATKILSVSSDGLENATSQGPCMNEGPFHTGSPPYPSTSWQARTINHFVGKNVTPHVWLFELDFDPFQATGTPAPDSVISREAGSRAAAPSVTAVSPLQEFFAILAQANGGTVNVVIDGQPLPVPGDLSGDRCVDRTDAILLARQFGPIVPPADGTFDLNADRTVGFADYRAQVSRITPACGPDPFVSRPPVVCSGPQEVVIDGQAIEGGGTTIEVRSACRIVIKNSLVVSGQNAITINGSAIVKVDNSIIVGENAFVAGARGTVILSAANTVFHGARRTSGAFSFIDRGGNVFE